MCLFLLCHYYCGASQLFAKIQPKQVEELGLDKLSFFSMNTIIL